MSRIGRTCGHDNRATAKYCEACAVPLQRACRGCGSALRPTARFCDECGQGERMQVTVLFADVKGSTALDEQLATSSPRRPWVWTPGRI